MKAQMRDANKMGAQFVLILGASELQNKDITLKNLKNSEQKKIKQHDIVDFFENLNN